MRGSEARRLIPEEPMKEKPMEARVATIENDVRNIKENVAKLSDEMKAANGVLASLVTGQAELRGMVDGVRVEMKGEITTLRAEVRGDIDGLRAELKGNIDGLRAELKGDISTVRAEMGTVRAEMGTIRAEMGTVRAEMGTLRAGIDGKLEALEGKIQRWFVATGLSCAGLAFAAVKLFQ
jgi:chromosome segregation ATPase